MGYTTEFTGSFKINTVLAPAHREYLTAFARTDRIKRDEGRADLLPDPIRKAAGLPIGPDGGYYVGEYLPGDPSVVDMAEAPWGQPSTYCQWVPTEDGTEIRWDEQEKFYEYVEWLEYLIKHFLHRWGYALNGSVSWQGEDEEDKGVIVVTDNEVRIQRQAVPQRERDQS